MRHFTRVEFDLLSRFLLDRFAFDDTPTRHDTSPPPPQPAWPDIQRPLVSRALKSARRMRRFSQQSSVLESALETIGLAVIRLDSRGQILDTTTQATKLLSHYCPPGERNQSLKSRNEWLRSHCSENAKHDAAPHLSKLATLEGERGDLTITLLKGENDWWVLLQERQNEDLQKRLREAGLTAREAEVLLWVMKGKTNAEVAVILGTQPATIKKQLKGIFIKFGINSRVAAVARTRALLKIRHRSPAPHSATKK